MWIAREVEKESFCGQIDEYGYRYTQAICLIYER